MEWPSDIPFPHILLMYPTVFYEDDKEINRETGVFFLSKGDGVVLENGPRYRVRDSWLSFDKHGRWDIGMHVFLESVEEGGEDDTLDRIAPEYFE